MPDERVIEDIENIFAEIIDLGGQRERTSIVPNMLVRDAAPTGLDDYIIIADDRDEDNILALTVPGVIYSDNDLVNVIFPKGGEAIAFQQGSQSASSGLWAKIPGTSTDIFFNQGDVGIGKSVAPDARLEVLDTAQAQLRLSHTEDTKFADFTVDTNHDLTIKPSSTGQIILQPTSDSVDFFQVLDADGGTPIFNVDSTNERIGMGTASPGDNVSIQGAIASSVIVGIYAGDGDGTDNVNFLVYGVGTPGSVANHERLSLAWRTADTAFKIESQALGSGTQRPLVLEAGSTNQIYLDTTFGVAFNDNTTAFTGEASTIIGVLALKRPDQGNRRGVTFLSESNNASRNAQNAFLRANASGGAVADTYRVGDIFWESHDGTDFNRSARFGAVIDGAVSANTTPTAIDFSTSETNSAGLTIRMTIASDGNIGVNGVTSPSTELDMGAGAIEFAEMTAPAAGAANTARLYAEDDSGTTRQQVKFSSGNAVTIAKDGGLQTYTPTNVVTDRSYDANATSVAELADVLGTLIADFQAAGVLG